MSVSADDAKEMKAIFAGLLAASEGGTDFILIPKLPLPVDCDPAAVDALLCLSPRDGYPSRLFLSAKIKHNGPGQNWNADQLILGRRWFAVSWKVDGAAARPMAILAGHLEAFTCKPK